MTNLQLLPSDVLAAVLAHLDAPQQVALALTCHALLDFVGRRAFDVVELNSAARREFLLLLEKDLPVDRLFCPGCNLVHRLSTTSSDVEPPALSAASNYSQLWECVKFDRRNEVAEVYGEKFYFYQARMALRLYRLRHINAETYLQSLDHIQSRGVGNRHFVRRAVRIVPAQDPQRQSELVVRVQDWSLYTDKEVAKDRHDLSNFTRLLVCFHMAYQGGVNKNGLRTAKSMRAAADSANGDAADHILDDIRRKPLIVRSLDDVLPINKKFSGFISYGTPDHCFTTLHRCITCQTEYRTDILRLEKFDPSSDSPLSRGIAKLRSSKPRWAIVTTKWMRLGALNAQNSWGWQGPAHVDAERELQDRPPGPTKVTGAAFAAFEGFSYGGETSSAGEPIKPGAHEYRPQWDHALRHCARKFKPHPE